MLTTQKLAVPEEQDETTVYPVLLALSFSHLLNDTIQSLIPSVYPVLKTSLNLSFTELGLITLTFQLTASLLQPLVGMYTDKNPKPFSLAIGMGFTLIGLCFLSLGFDFLMILGSVALVGVGSSVFHPEASRMAYLASGGKRGLAQSLFQVGGNFGSSLGPLLAALIVVPFGQFNLIWFTLVALLAIVVLYNIGGWYKTNLPLHQTRQKKGTHKTAALPRKTIVLSLCILLMLIFSKYFYMASLTSYFTFFLIDKFNVSVQTSQVYLFIFLVSIAAGTFLGGPIGDRFGRKFVIWFSILGVAPFTLLLPYVNIFYTGILIAVIGFILSSAFSAILVYAQELIPGKVGMVSGLFFGLAFGMGGIGSAVLGWLADLHGIQNIFKVCAFLPLIGMLTAFLPDLRKHTKVLS